MADITVHIFSRRIGSPVKDEAIIENQNKMKICSISWSIPHGPHFLVLFLPQCILLLLFT